MNYIVMNSRSFSSRSKQSMVLYMFLIIFVISSKQERALIIIYVVIKRHYYYHHLILLSYTWSGTRSTILPKPGGIDSVHLSFQHFALTGGNIFLVYFLTDIGSYVMHLWSHILCNWRNLNIISISSLYVCMTNTILI